MRVVALAALVVVGCQPPPGPHTAMPASDLPACSTWDPAWTRLDCRTDQIRDVDGDGVADCVRVVASAGSVDVMAWPRCAGESIAISIPRQRFDREQTVLPIVLPEALRAPAWVRAIADVLVGADHVSCEHATPGCAPPDPALAWLSDASRPELPGWGHMRSYTPRWQDGAPHEPPIEALVLDSGRPRREVIRPKAFQLAPAQLVVLDARHQLLARYGTCSHYETFAADTLAAVVDRTSGRWSWVQIGDEPRIFDAACDGEVAFVAHGVSTDTTMVYGIRPTTGVFVDVTPDREDWRAILNGTVAVAPTVTLAQLAALIELPTTLPPCTTTSPLLEIDGAHACRATGHDAGLCWTAAPLGNADAGLIEWSLEATSCGNGGPSTSATIAANHVISSPSPSVPLRWLADRAVGADHVHCIPATASCAGPSAALLRLVDVAEAGTSPLRWQVGAPAPLHREAVVIAQPALGTGRPSELRLVLFDPKPPAIDDRPLERAGPCGTFELWSSPSAAAAVDVARHRHAWLWIATEPFEGDVERAADRIPDPIRRTSCDHGAAMVELASHEHVRIDLR